MPLKLTPRNGWAYYPLLLHRKPPAAILYQQGGLTAQQKDARTAAQLQEQLSNGTVYNALDFTWDDAQAELKEAGHFPPLRHR